MKRAQEPSNVDYFAPARARFEEMLGEVGGADGPEHHAEIEERIESMGREVHRLVLQGRLTEMFAQEADRFRRRRPCGAIRVRARGLESPFGRVAVRRHGIHRAGEASSRFPLDERLGLPQEVYSLGLRRRVAEETRAQSWDEAVARVDATTGGHVPKRQAEELVARAAQDFDAYYVEREQRETANDTASAQTLLVMSCDGKGIAMRPEALREATRKQAERAQRKESRGDPTEVRSKRPHSKRMATVTAVWDQDPCERSAYDIIRKLRREGGDAEVRVLPRPKHKRVTASIEKSLAEGVAELFDEADRRDPHRERPSLMLIDGAEYQADVVLAEAKRRGRDIVVVLDLLHALHYIWLAGMAVRRGDRAKTEAWVQHYLHKLLTAGMPQDVIAGINQAATLAGLTQEERKPVAKCVSYLKANIGGIRYREFLEAGYPIATGVIEGACRHLVQDRLGITGARWGLASAEAILRLRALNTNGDWDDYWRYHLRKERERRYARDAA